MIAYLKQRSDREAFLLLDELVQQMNLGTQRNGDVCPKCGGGSKSEKSFSIHRERDGSYYYYCHRASCDFNGRRNLPVGAAFSQPLDATIPPETKPRLKLANYAKRLVDIPDKVKQYLKDEWNIGEWEISKWCLRWAPDEKSKDACGRLYIPVLDAHGALTGCVMRSVDGDEPKALRYVFKVVESKAWFRNTGSYSLFVVEDMISAIRLAKYSNVLCLMGTSMNLSDAIDAKAAGVSWSNAKFQWEPFPNGAYLLLDADALNKALEMAVKLKTYLPMKVCFTDKDPKNMAESDLWEFVNKVRTGTYSYRVKSNETATPLPEDSKSQNEALITKLSEETARRMSLGLPKSGFQENLEKFKNMKEDLLTLSTKVKDALRSPTIAEVLSERSDPNEEKIPKLAAEYADLFDLTEAEAEKVAPKFDNVSRVEVEGPPDVSHIVTGWESD